MKTPNSPHQPTPKFISLENASAGDVAGYLLSKNPNAGCVIQLTDSELRRGWRVGDVLRRLKVQGRVRILGPGSAVVE
jgi:hypothetical protein